MFKGCWAMTFWPFGAFVILTPYKAHITVYTPIKIWAHACMSPRSSHLVPMFKVCPGKYLA